MSLQIETYSGNEEEWDDFVNNKSMNGTFLQTRNFINYHKQGKFKDCSLIVRKGNEIVAAILACESDGAEKTFIAHSGSTFGGITISSKIYSATAIDELMSLLDDYLKQNGFDKVIIKVVPNVYQNKNSDLLDYFLYKYGYECFDELNYYMQLDRYREDILSQFSSSKRRDYRYSLRNGLRFKSLETRNEIAVYYDVLQMNLKKLNLPSVHSLEDLFDLKFNRFNDRIKFYGVYKDEKIIAGSMIFIFGDDIFHTQYLSSDEHYLSLYPMDYLIMNLIQESIELNMRIFTFGICTENHGKYLNLGLSRFKEGFGTEYCINRTYERHF